MQVSPTSSFLRSLRQESIEGFIPGLKTTLVCLEPFFCFALFFKPFLLFALLFLLLFDSLEFCLLLLSDFELDYILLGAHFF